MPEDIFSGLEDLGFDNVKDVELYEKEKVEEKSDNKASKNISEANMLYEKEIECPICKTKFKVKAVKTSYYKIYKKDSDFFLRYAYVNPYFYDVYVCNTCGYSAMKVDFNKIRDFEKESIIKNISIKWKCKEYAPIYDVEIAIQRYKLALLNYCAIKSKSSKKAMTCLKIAWMYRILENNENENKFLKNALIGFEEAFFNESFPIYGLDKFSCMYLIGEINRRVGNNKEALKWFGQVLVVPGAKVKIKDMARDQRDLIREEEKIKLEYKLKKIEDENKAQEHIKSDETIHKGFFNRIFKR